jgi:hypothetical protein
MFACSIASRAPLAPAGAEGGVRARLAVGEPQKIGDVVR